MYGWVHMYTHEQVIARTCTNESCHTYKRIVLHIQIRDVTYMNVYEYIMYMKI